MSYGLYKAISSYDNTTTLYVFTNSRPRARELCNKEIGGKHYDRWIIRETTRYSNVWWRLIIDMTYTKFELDDIVEWDKKVI